jgi:hypothetical protein
VFGYNEITGSEERVVAVGYSSVLGNYLRCGSDSDACAKFTVGVLVRVIYYD